MIFSLYLVENNIGLGDGLIMVAYNLIKFSVYYYPIRQCVSPMYKMIRRCFHRVKAYRYPTEHTIDDKDAAKHFEGTYVNMSYKYAYLLHTVLFAVFYSNLIPIILPFALLGLILQYWTDKCSLLKVNKIPPEMGEHLV